MKRLLQGLFLASALSVSAVDLPEITPVLPPEIAPENHDGYWYVSGGLVVIAPKISVGYRFQRGNFGGDISFTEATIPPEFFSQGLQINQLYYPKPDLKKEAYFGISEGLHYVVWKYLAGGLWEASLGLVGGYQFQTERRRHFIEGKMGFPFQISKAAKYPVPVPSIAYGVSF